ncbi:MAG: agmatinase [Oscillospiraceae bacterium]|nr:agmatinase [Oscillospiraceae bacterium]
MLEKNTETFISCDAEYSEASIVLFGAPFDGTTSFRPGTRFAPRAIRGDSFGIETYSPYQNRDLTQLKVFDCGDLDFPFGNTQRVLNMVEAHTGKVLTDGKLPFMLGGEHLLTLGAVKAVFKKHPDLHLIHFDAHTDLRDEYLGEELSHASVMRRIWDFLGDGRIHQFGIRSGEKYEFEFAKRHTDFHPFNMEGLEETVQKIGTAPVYFSLDLDVLDPSCFPGTGTPEPGGISFKELLNAVLALSTLNIVGCDINELSPPYDPSGISTAAACKILREVLLVIGNGSL